MILTMDAQLISLIISVFAGLTIGLLFDLYRTLNYYIRPPRGFLYFMDLFFWIATCVIVFTLLLNADFAELRIYTFAGMGIGLLIYFKLFSQYILWFYRFVIYIMLKAMRVSYMLIRLPFRLVYNALWYPMEAVKRSAGGIGRKIYSRVSPKLKNLRKM